MSQPQRASGVSWRRASAPRGLGGALPGCGAVRAFAPRGRRAAALEGGGVPSRSGPVGGTFAGQLTMPAQQASTNPTCAATGTVPDFSLSFQVSRQP